MKKHINAECCDITGCEEYRSLAYCDVCSKLICNKHTGGFAINDHFVRFCPSCYLNPIAPSALNSKFPDQGIGRRTH